MLVLTRKLQEQIRIGDNVIVTVLRVKGNSVRIGIEAPRETRIVRGELPVFDTSPETPVEMTTASGEAASLEGIEVEETRIKVGAARRDDLARIVARAVAKSVV